MGDLILEHIEIGIVAKNINILDKVRGAKYLLMVTGGKIWASGNYIQLWTKDGCWH